MSHEMWRVDSDMSLRHFLLHVCGVLIVYKGGVLSRKMSRKVRGLGVGSATDSSNCESLLSPPGHGIDLRVGILWAFGTVLRQFVPVFRLNMAL